MLQRQFRKTSGKIYKYYSIVEPYFEQGKNKKRIIARLGVLEDTQAEKIKAALKLRTHPDMGLYGLGDVGFVRCWDYLDVAFLKEEFDRFGIAKLLDDNRALISPAQVLAILVIHRILAPGSKLRATRWLRDNFLTCLLELNAEQVQCQHIYRALPSIEQAKTSFEDYVFSYLKTQGSTFESVFYDMSSSYFEGTCVELGEFNAHSKDHRPDRLQVELGILVNENGIPFAWDLFPGNKGESPVMIQQVNKIKERFALKKTLLIFDRGFLSDKNLKYIERNGYHYLTGLDSPQINTLLDVYLPHFHERLNESNAEEEMRKYRGENGYWTSYDENKYYFQPKNSALVVNDRKTALTFDVDRFKRIRYQRGIRLDRFKKWVTKHNVWLSHFKKDASRKAIENDVNSELKRLALTNYVTYDLHQYINDDQIFIQKKNQPYASQGYTRRVKTFKIVFSSHLEEKLDGFFALVCSPQSDLSPKQMVYHYREKYRIEEAFRNMKSLLKLRPWFVYKEEHVRAHYSICVIAYVLKKLIDEKLQRAGLKDEGYTLESILEQFHSIKAGEIALGPHKKIALTAPTPLIKQWLSALGQSKLLNTPQN
ncbi:MAG: IS1634 family transposase [Candidatus Bathyarchaeota archaeon]